MRKIYVNERLGAAIDLSEIVMIGAELSNGSKPVVLRNGHAFPLYAKEANELRDAWLEYNGVELPNDSPSKVHLA